MIGIEKIVVVIAGLAVNVPVATHWKGRDVAQSSLSMEVTTPRHLKGQRMLSGGKSIRCRPSCGIGELDLRIAHFPRRYKSERPLAGFELLRHVFRYVPEPGPS